MSKELKIGGAAFLVLMLCLYAMTLMKKAHKTIDRVDIVIELIEGSTTSEIEPDSIKIIINEIGDSTKSKIRKFIRQ